MRPEDILPTYERVAHGFAAARDRSLFERRWLDRMLNHAPGRQVLDLGCGPGLPIARYLVERRCRVTGVDGAPTMMTLFRNHVPEAHGIEADMRQLDLGRAFDVILAWNSFFHLAPQDQKGMFRVFAAHAAPRSVLMFTTGHKAGQPIGRVEGEPVYHASLDPEEYRALLDDYGFDVVSFVPRDPDCAGHSVWLARMRVPAA